MITRRKTPNPEEAAVRQNVDIARDASEIVAAIVRDLSDRRGLRQAWDAIDAQIQDEITARWVQLTVARMRDPR